MLPSTAVHSAPPKKDRARAAGALTLGAAAAPGAAAAGAPEAEAEGVPAGVGVPAPAPGAEGVGLVEGEGVGEALPDAARLALGVALPLGELGGWVQPLASGRGAVPGGQGAHHVAPATGA